MKKKPKILKKKTSREKSIMMKKESKLKVVKP
jgi:hypothetical protein